jgi:hypothetical protein
MSERFWYAVTTAGRFRQGQTYHNSQLGVLGRMAAKVGYLVPTEPPAPRKPKPIKRARKPRKVVTDAVAGGAEPGTGETDGAD